MGQGQLYEVQKSKVLGPALASQQLYAAQQAGRRVAGKLVSMKGPASPGQHSWTWARKVSEAKKANGILIIRFPI